AAVSLPDLSRDAQRATPNEQLRARIAVGFRRIVFFILPSSLAFVALAPVIVRPLFQTGRFAAADTALVGGVLAAYGGGLPAQAGPLTAALLALAIFGGVYFGGTIALRHPDARRLWTFLR